MANKILPPFFIIFNIQFGADFLLFSSFVTDTLAPQALILQGESKAFAQLKIMS